MIEVTTHARGLARYCLASVLACAFAPAAAANETPPPVVLSATYTTEVFGNVRGGLKTGVEHLDNLDVTLSVDLDRTIGWRGASAFVYGLANSGSRLTDRLIGDLQGVSNIDTIGAARLYEAWIDQTLAGGAVSLRAGLYDLNSEFDTNDTAALFLNSSHGIGPDISQTGRNGPSIFPVTSLAARLEVRASSGLTLRAAVLDGVPGDPDRPRRTAIKLGDGDGALAIGEVNHASPRHKLALGYWHYTGRFDAVDGGGRGRGNAGVYAFAHGRVLNDARGGGRGLAAFVRAGRASARFNPVRTYLGGGAEYVGPFGDRAEDRLGFAVAHVRLGSPYEQATLIAGEPARGSETKFEITYRAPLRDWLTVQPDVQYVARPSGVVGRPDALAIGLRVEMGF